MREVSNQRRSCDEKVLCVMPRLARSGGEGSRPCVRRGSSLALRNGSWAPSSGAHCEADQLLGSLLATPSTQKFILPSSSSLIDWPESVWCVTTSAFCEISVLAASRSLPGSYHELTQITRTSAFGLTLRAPRVNALMPCRTSGIGNAAT